MIIGARIIVALGCQTVLQNPLMNDYVKLDSRGKGAGTEKLGYVIGVAIACVCYSFMVSNP